MKVGFTGTQKGMTSEQKISVSRILSVREGEFHHGDCVGADSDAHDIAKGRGMRIVLHPPVNSIKRAFREADTVRNPKPYLDRNKDIVRETDILIATPSELSEQLRSGTWSTVRFARKLGRSVYIVMPNGSIRAENVYDVLQERFL